MGLQLEAEPGMQCHFHSAGIGHYGDKDYFQADESMAKEKAKHTTVEALSKALREERLAMNWN